MKTHYKVTEARNAAKAAIAKWEAANAKKAAPVLKLVVNNK